MSAIIPPPFVVGTLIRGYCHGAFGDSYGDKRVEGVGVDWLVVREVDSGKPNAYLGDLADLAANSVCCTCERHREQRAEDGGR